MTRIRLLLNKYFYFFMSLLIAVVVAYGFSHTVDTDLIHAVPVRPTVLYLHAAIFSGWVIFLILQSAMVRTHNVRAHRFVGWFGVVLGTTIPLLGIWTAVTMARFKIHSLHLADGASGLMFSFFDMTAFSIPFALSIYWRRRPEYHRRLVLVASCALTSAAFARFPPPIPPPGWFYADLDVLILIGAFRDLILNRSIHRVYLFVIPTYVLGQTLVMYTGDWPYWTRIFSAVSR